MSAQGTVQQEHWRTFIFICFDDFADADAALANGQLITAMHPASSLQSRELEIAAITVTPAHRTKRPTLGPHTMNCPVTVSERGDPAFDTGFGALHPKFICRPLRMVGRPHQQIRSA
jgi:hypothetical protein